MLGYPAEKFKHFIDFVNLVHPEDRDRVMDAMQRHIDGFLEKYDTYYRIKTVTGDFRWFHDTGSIVKRDSKGLPIRVTGLVFDVTDQKKTEEALLSFGHQFEEPIPKLNSPENNNQN